MKKILLTALLSLSFSIVAHAKQNPNVEFNTVHDCKMGGCSLVCTPNGKAGNNYVKARKIDLAVETIFKSGTVRYKLRHQNKDSVVTIPTGTESCKLTNVSQ